MALTVDEHLRRAQYNESFAKWLGGAKSKWPSWTMTALFYAALHQAQALLVANGLYPADHFERNHDLLAWPSVRVPYMRLSQYSREARYDGKDHDERFLQHALDLLDDVKAAVAAELGSSP